MTFYYTDELNRASKAVQAAYYNESTNKVLVVTHNDTGYVYDNVGRLTWRNFQTAASVGNFYATVIKRDYGPGTYVGSNPEVTNGVPAPSMAAVGTSKNLTYAPGAKVTSISGDPARVRLISTGESILPAAKKQRTEVFFKAEGSTTERSWTTEALSVPDATAALAQVFEALGLDYAVTKVVTYFD